MARLAALGDLAPRRHQLLPTAPRLGLAGAPAVGVVDRIARDAAVDGADAPMTRTARLAENDVLVFEVADLADGRQAVFVDPPNFPRGQTNLRVTSVARHERRGRTGAADHLAAAAGSQFEIVNWQADGNRLERKAIANFRRRRRAAHQLRADMEADRGDDVALFAVGVFQQRQPGGAAGIIFDGRDLRFDAELVPLEIDLAQLLLVAAADTAGRNAAIAIAPARLFANLEQAFFGRCLRDLVVRRDRDVSRRGR